MPKETVKKDLLEKMNVPAEVSGNLFIDDNFMTEAECVKNIYDVV